MKSSILTASYLWKDIWSTWFERPGSLLSKGLVTVILSSLATVLLVAFSLLERDLTQRLEAFGLDTVVVSESLHPQHPRLLQPFGIDPLLKPFQEVGSIKVFRQSGLTTRGPNGEFIQVWLMPDQDFQIALLSSPNNSTDGMNSAFPAILTSTRYPAGSQIPFQLGNLSLLATNIPKPAFSQALPDGTKLFIPGSLLPPSPAQFAIEIHQFKLDQNLSDDPLSSWIQRIQSLYQLENRPGTSLQSSLRFQDELDSLRQQQVVWRTLLALLLGIVLALILGSLSFLEFQQNQYVNALFRSFGAPAPLLFSRFWLESLLIVNTCTIAGIALIRTFHPVIFGTLQFPPPVLYGDLNIVYFSTEIGFLFLWANVGSFLSILPIGFILRRPVGVVLS